MNLCYIASLCLGICGVSLAKSWDVKDHEQTDGHVHDGDEIRSRIESKLYLKNEDQTWFLSAETGVWALVFKQLSIEPSWRCEHDYLEVVELTNSIDSIVTPARFCGDQLPLPYLSRHSNLRLRFVTDALWELEGFRIRAVHANNTDALAEKISKLSTSDIGPPLALPAKKAGSGNDEIWSERGSLFFILIGASSASFLVFGALLAYLIVAIRKAPPPSPVVVPGMYCNINREIVTQQPTKLNGGMDTNTILQVDSKRGRRYLKDKSGTRTCQGDTCKKTSFPVGNSEQNNVYTISNLVAHNKSTVFT